ncbi:MAG TPA: AAA family ATPase [Ilumatobacteraceae bacterium]|nr:AAA family ATPase [Ilumatobacteraceae bacterium]
MHLLERDEELSWLGEWLGDTEAGHGRVVFVGGEPGIGKTSLVTTFAATVGDAVRVGFGRCDALVTPRALGPFLEAAAALGIEVSEDRDGLVRGVVDNLRGSGPTLMIIEDAHWADEATTEVLGMLGRRAVDLPVLLVVTYRENEVTVDHPLRVVLGDLATSASSAWLALRPLSLDAVRTLAVPEGASPEELYQRTGGNPFYVTEALAEPGTDVPTTVRLAVLARASRLTPSARALVDAVSVVPGRAERWLIDAMCDPSYGDLDLCVRRGVLVADEGTLAFRHEVARLAVETELGEGQRRELHGRVVDALTQRPDTDPARIAHHADASGDEAAAARYSMDASLQASARAAHREAVRHGERALAVRHALSADEVAALQTRLAFSLVASDRAEEAIRLTSEAVAHWRAAGDELKEADALTVLANALGSSGRTAAGMEAIARSIELLESHPPGPELAAAYTRLASSHMLARDRDTAVAWGERAISLAAELGDPILLGRALIETGIADVMDQRFEGLARINQAIELGRQHRLPSLISHGYSQIGSGCGELRRYDLAVPALIDVIAVASEHSLEANRRYGVAWLARCRFDQGQWDEAETHARHAVSGSTSMPYIRFVALNTLGWLRARRGSDDVWPLLDEALEIADAIGHLQRLWPSAVARAEAGWLDGDLESHVALLESTFELATECRHSGAMSELAVWLQRAGRDVVLPEGVTGPFADWVAGDHLGAAVGFRRMGSPYEAASALEAAGDTASLREALATFERLGAARAADNVAAELRRRGVRVAARRGRNAGEAGHPTGLTDRELEVVRLVAAGFTNPQIAAALYISRKTAEHHVSSILVKLGVSSRTEAAAAAVRLEIVPG